MSKKWGEKLIFFIFQKAQKTEHWRGRKGQNQCKSHKPTEMWANCQSSLELFIDLLIKFSIYHDIPGPTELCSAMLGLPWCKLLFGLRLQATRDLPCLEQAIIHSTRNSGIIFHVQWIFLEGLVFSKELLRKSGSVKDGR